MKALAAREDDSLRAESKRIEALLGEVRAMVGPASWQRVEELVQRMVGLYGEGLGRLLARLDEGGRLSLCDDELLSSLLLLHGLHPLPLRDRIERALDGVRPYLGSHAGGVELLEASAEGVRLRLLGTCQGCPSSQKTAEGTLRKAVEEAAPDAGPVAIEGAAEAVRLPQIGAAGPDWVSLPPFDAPPGEPRRIAVAGTMLLALRAGGALVAYRDRCPSCGASLAGAVVRGSELACSCGARFDTSLAGRPLLGDAALDPVPLLEGPSGVRVLL